MTTASAATNSGRISHLVRDLQRDRDHPVDIAVQQIAGVDRQSADADRQTDVQDVAERVRADGGPRKHGELQRRTCSRSRPPPLVTRPTEPNAW